MKEIWRLGSIHGTLGLVVGVVVAPSEALDVWG